MGSYDRSLLERVGAASSRGSLVLVRWWSLVLIMRSKPLAVQRRPRSRLNVLGNNIGMARIAFVSQDPNAVRIVVKLVPNVVIMHVVMANAMARNCVARSGKPSVTVLVPIGNVVPAPIAQMEFVTTITRVANRSARAMGVVGSMAVPELARARKGKVASMVSVVRMKASAAMSTTIVVKAHAEMGFAVQQK